MAKPQLEDGHTKIANEIVEALARVNLTAHEGRLLWCILRKTYGWNKKIDRISYSQFEVETGIGHRQIGRSLASLKQRGIIICVGTGYSLEYGLQKDYELWDTIRDIPGTDSGTSEIPNQGHPRHQIRDIRDTKSGTSQVLNSDIKLVPHLAQLGTSQVLNSGTSQALPLSPTPPIPLTKTNKALYKSKYIPKQKFGELLNVFLTAEDYEKLVTRFGAQGATDWIEELSLAKASKGYKTKSDYATILAWERRGKRKQSGGGNGANRANPETGYSARLKASAAANEQ